MVRIEWKRWVLLLVVGCWGAPDVGTGEDGRQLPSLLHPLFQDHAVLQRDRPIRVWGTATNDEQVVVSLAGERQTVRTDAAGGWAATLPPLPAGGPYTLTVRGTDGETVSAEDVLLGDVFLCSGQSNMVLQVHRTLNSPAEIESSDNNRLRLLAVGMTAELEPAEEFPQPVEWQIASPATVPHWSATCYYFARELQESVDVPIGLVVAAWGGSNIRSWMSEAALHATGDYEEQLEILRLYATDPAAGIERWGTLWEDWWRSRAVDPPGSEPWSTVGSGEHEWASAPDGLGAWEGWGAQDLADFDGMVWYRTTVRLTPEQAAQSAVLSLGKVDEIDQTWVNSRSVGATSGAGTERHYRLPKELLREGENVIVVNVLDTWGSGGLYGGPESRALHLSQAGDVPLDRGWRYRVVPVDVGFPPRAPWDPTGGLTTIFNGMVAPIGPFGFRAAVWYQGESNTGDPERYERLLSGLMADWRTRFGAELPFLIVQLANYGQPPTAPIESGWAQLREAQRLVVAEDAHAGLAITIDIGDRFDIHPANKQEVGRRLARVARHVIYGEPITPSGPVALRAWLAGGRVVVEFGDIEGELVAYGAEGPIGFELCGDEPGSCRFVSADLEGDRVLLEVPASTTAERVRFCWADSPICTLFDGAGLPVGPFELRVE